MNNLSKRFEYLHFSDEQLRSTILSKTNINLLANLFVNKAKLTQLREDQKNDFLSFIKKLNFYELNKAFNGPNKVDDINNKIINLYVNRLNTKRETTDTHELLKKEIGAKGMGQLPEEKYLATIMQKNKDSGIKKTSIETPKAIIPAMAQVQNSSKSLTDLSKEELIDLTKIMNFESLWKDSYIIIDSRYRSLANLNRQEVEFNIIQNTKTKVPGSGNIYAHGDTRQIVQMEIFPFSIPFVDGADNYYNKITMSIKEMLGISFEAYEDSQFHFMFTATTVQNLIQLVPINSIFRFHKPITHIGGSFTLRFGGPFAPITFNKDRLNTSSIDYTTNPIEITFAENHNQNTGDLIYIEDFNTSNPAADIDIINDINRKEGHLCTRINNLTFTININGNLITSPNLSHTSEVYFGSSRIFIPMRFRYLLTASSNST